MKWWDVLWRVWVLLFGTVFAFGALGTWQNQNKQSKAMRLVESLGKMAQKKKTGE